MTEFETGRRQLLKLCGTGATAAGLGALGGSALAADVAGDEGLERPDQRASVGPPRRAQLGPENVRLATERGAEPLTSEVFADFDNPGEIIAGRAVTSSSSQEQSVDVGVTLAATGHGTLSSFSSSASSVPADATLDIWAGAYIEETTENGESLPVGQSGESLAVTVAGPDGSTEEFSLETDEAGAASMTYDLAEQNAQPGSYELTVAHETVDFPPSVEFTVGPALSIIKPGTFEEQRLAGRETTLVVLGREGAAPSEGTEATLRIEQGGSQVGKQTVVTGEDGFATHSFTPTETGTYIVTLERDGQDVDSHEFRCVDATIATTNEFSYGVAGVENFYCGYLYTASGPATNTEFQLRFEHEEPIVERTVQTDQNGFFGITYELPENLNEELDNTNLDVIAEREGQELGLMDDSISVSAVEPDLDMLEEDPIQLEIEGNTERLGLFKQDVVVPGESATISLTASQEDEPVAGMDVDVAVQFGRDGPVVASRTVTTADDGTTSFTVDVPATAPDGASLSITARGMADGEPLTGTRSASIQVFEVPLPIEIPNTIPGPGEQATVEFEATDLRTGDPAPGQHRQIDYEYDTAFSGSFARASLTTGADGTDETAVQVPDDAMFLEQLRPFDAYLSGSLSLDLLVDLDGELTAPETVRPGEELDLTFGVPGDATATGFVAISNRLPTHTLGSTLTSGESVTIQIPEHADDRFPYFGEFFDEDFLPVTVWARGTDGTLYGGRWRVHVEDTDDPADGEDGTDGNDGDDGTDGSDGDDGTDGTDGEDGSDGTDGDDGTDGTDGDDGSDGDDDSTGAEGESGDGDGIGFGVLTGLAGLGLSGYLASKRAGGDDSR
jgi:hypothetical protein